MYSFKQFIIEGEGLTNRRPGETFVDKDKSPMIFVSVEFFPTKDDFEGDLDSVTFVNKPLSNLTSLGIAIFKNSAGEDLLFGKWVKPGTKAWPNSNPNYFEYESKATAKEKSGLKPSEFLDESKMENLSMDDILQQVGEAFGTDSPLYAATKQAIAGEPISVVIGNLSETAITNYFVEILQPIALIKGNYGGNAKEGIKAITGTKDISNFLINFPKGVRQGLYDSYLTSGVSQINISSKFGSAAKSAAASVTNLYTLYKNFKDKDIFKDFKLAIDISRIIAESSAVSAPLELALLLDNVSSSSFVFTKDEYKLLLDLQKNPNLKLTTNLIKLRDTIKPGSDKTPPVFNHVLAGIAKSVCEYINKDVQVIKFSRFASILLNGNTIQVYTRASKATKAGVDVLVFDKFHTVWPSDAVTNVFIESATRYKTDRVDGKLGYEIKSK